MDCASKNPVDLDEIYQNDCFVEAVVFVRGHATIIGGVAVAIASIMVRVLKSKQQQICDEKLKYHIVASSNASY